MPTGGMAGSSIQKTSYSFASFGSNLSMAFLTACGANDIHYQGRIPRSLGRGVHPECDTAQDSRCLLYSFRSG